MSNAKVSGSPHLKTHCIPRTLGEKSVVPANPEQPLPCSPPVVPVHAQHLLPPQWPGAPWPQTSKNHTNSAKQGLPPLFTRQPKGETGTQGIQKQHLLRRHEQGLEDAVHVARVSQVDQTNLARVRLGHEPGVEASQLTLLRGPGILPQQLLDAVLVGNVEVLRRE